MKRGLVVPDELRRGPFSIAEAERAGVNREELRGAAYRPVTRGVYVATELDDGPMSRLRGLATRLRPGCAFSGLAAALVHGLIALHGRAWGVPQARRILDLVEPGAQSPIESRLRMLLVLRGLPRPQAQMPILDRRGRTVGYADLGYPGARLGTEYDGATHRTSLAADDRRQNQIQLAGVRLLRFTAADVYKRPREVAEEVRAALPRSA